VLKGQARQILKICVDVAVPDTAQAHGLQVGFVYQHALKGKSIVSVERVSWSRTPYESLETPQNPLDKRPGI
jgi:hypothetical protein